MKAKALLFGASLILTAAAARAVEATRAADWRCGTSLPRPSLSIDQFAVAYLGGTSAELPLFLQDWVQQVVDRDRDNQVSASEAETLVCRASRVMMRELEVAGGPLVKADGRLDWEGYHAADQVVSGNELRVELGSFARQWVGDQLRRTGHGGLVANLEAAAWTVSARELEEQFDLVGEDHSHAARLSKYLSLAYILSELKVRSGETYSEALGTYVSFGLKNRNFPWIQSVKTSPLEMNLAANQATRSSFTVEDGFYRYYILRGVPVRLRSGQAEVWGQPSEQVNFTLGAKKIYPETSSFQGSLEKKLRRLCQRKDQVWDLHSTENGSRLVLQGRLQALVTELSDSFLVDPLEVVVQQDPLKDSSTAYLSKEDSRIYFSWPLLEDVRQVSSAADYNRHLRFLALQEFIHYLQSQSEAYELNFRLYNNPQHAYLLFGEVGYQDWYLAQPTERDAQGLAGQFVRSLENGCTP